MVTRNISWRKLTARWSLEPETNRSMPRTNTWFPWRCLSRMKLWKGELRICFKRRTDLTNRVRIWYDAGRNLKRKFHPPKERQRCPPDCGSCKFSVCDKDSCFEKNLIYRVQCSVCERYYIGETSRMIGTRIKEHTSQSNPTSAIVEHFRTEHPGSVIRVGWKILHRNQQQYWKRKSLERHYILSAEGDLINRNDGCDIWLFFSSFSFSPFL